MPYRIAESITKPINQYSDRLVLMISINLSVPTSLTVSIKSTHPPILPANASPDAPRGYMRISENVTEVIRE